MPCTVLNNTGSTVTLVRPDIFQWVGETSRAKVAPTAVQIQTVTGQLFPMRGSKLLQLHLGEVWVVDIQASFSRREGIWIWREGK